MGQLYSVIIGGHQQMVPREVMLRLRKEGNQEKADEAFSECKECKKVEGVCDKHQPKSEDKKEEKSEDKKEDKKKDAKIQTKEEKKEVKKEDKEKDL